MQQLSKSRAVHLPQPLPCPHPPHGMPFFALPWHWCSCTCTCCLPPPPPPHPACAFFLQKLTAAEKRVESAENVWLRGIWMISACLFVKIPQLLGSPALPRPPAFSCHAAKECQGALPGMQSCCAPACLPAISLYLSRSLSISFALSGTRWHSLAATL